jgi:hypothetical protein
MNKVTREILLIGAALVIVGPLIVFLILISAVHHTFEHAGDPETDPSEYQEIVKYRAKQWDVYGFLPAEIPEDALQVGFLHVAGLLQGRDVVALRLTLPSDRVALVVKALENSDRTEVTTLEGTAHEQVFPAYDIKRTEVGEVHEHVTPLPEGF